MEDILNSEFNVLSTSPAEIKTPEQPVEDRYKAIEVKPMLQQIKEILKNAETI